MHSTLHVLYQFNEKYVPYAGVSITSLFENNKNVPEIHVYLMTEDVSQESKNMFLSLAKTYNRTIHFPDTSELITQMKNMGMPAYRNSYAANMRLFFHNAITEDIDRLVYLDSDTVVCGNLLPLAYCDLNDCPIGMCFDSLVEKHHKTSIGLTPTDPYFNSGVLVFDVKKWISEKWPEKIIEKIKNSGANYALPDQDVFNIVFKNQITPLNAHYNLQPVHVAFSPKQYLSCFKHHTYHSCENLANALKKPVVIHFERFLGEFPWHAGNLHPDNDYFDHYLALSPWKDYKKEAETLSALNKIQRILYRTLPRIVYLYIFKYSHTLYIYVNAVRARKKFKTKL